MSLFQMASAALDGFSTSMAVLTISLYQALPKAQTRHQPILHVCLVLSILVVVPARLHLWPLLILLFLSARKLKTHWASFTSLACLSTVLIWVTRVSRSTIDLRRGQPSTDTVQTTIQFLSHPDELISVLARTLTNHELLNFYGHSFIGLLGWLHLPLKPPLAYPIGPHTCDMHRTHHDLDSAKTLAIELKPPQWILVGMALLSAMSVFLYF